MTKHEVFTKARALIIDERDWRQGHVGYLNGKGPYCAMEALYTVARGEDAIRALRELKGSVGHVPVWNDTHTHAEVIAVFDELVITTAAREPVTA